MLIFCFFHILVWQGYFNSSCLEVIVKIIIHTCVRALFDETNKIATALCYQLIIETASILGPVFALLI